MHNWNTDLTRLKKSGSAYDKFALEQMINFGLNQRKISLTALRKFWSQLRLDPAKKKYLEQII